MDGLAKLRFPITEELRKNARAPLCLPSVGMSSSATSMSLSSSQSFSRGCRKAIARARYRCSTPVAKGYDPFFAHIHEGVGPSAAFVGDWLATEILDRILRQKRGSAFAFRDRGRIRCFLNDNLAAHVTVV